MVGLMVREYLSIEYRLETGSSKFDFKICGTYR